jgi:hypothetical protein
MTDQRSIVRGTTEYIYVTVTSGDAAITLNAQPVVFSFDNANWITGEWVGSAATTRQARFLLTPALTPAKANNVLYVRVTDSPEIPDMHAGRLFVED